MYALVSSNVKQQMHYLYKNSTEKIVGGQSLNKYSKSQVSSPSLQLTVLPWTSCLTSESRWTKQGAAKISKFYSKNVRSQGAWMAHSVEHMTLDPGFKPHAEQ